MKINEHLNKALNFLNASIANGWLPYSFPYGKDPSCEATAWVAIALSQSKDTLASTKKAIDFLLNNQNQDGGWSTGPGIGESDWTTAAVTLSLRLAKSYQPQIIDDRSFNQAIKNAFHYLIVSRVDSMFPVLRLMLFLGAQTGGKQKFGKGWPWVKHGGAWIEPTAYALMALKLPGLPDDQLTQIAVSHANDFILDHTCKGGGWNCGNYFSLGHYYQAHILPTAEVVLSLSDISNHIKVKEGLNHLLASKGECLSPWTLSWQILALNAYGQDCQNNLSQLANMQNKDGSFADNFMVSAFASLALNTVNGINPFKIKGEFKW